MLRLGRLNRMQSYIYLRRERPMDRTFDSDFHQLGVLLGR